MVILGSAGHRIITAGEILGLAGLSAGLRATQKNEYDITVLRGPSISEIILSPQEIGYTGIDRPTVVLALSQEGVDRRKHLFDRLDSNALVVRDQGVDLPPCHARLYPVDFKRQGIKAPDRALAALAVMAKLNKVIHLEMLQSALAYRFKGKVLKDALELVQSVEAGC